MLPIHKKYALIHGFFLGILLCILTVICYFFYPDMLFNSTYHSTIFVVIFLMFPVLMLFINYNNSFTYKEYFSIVFLVLSVASLLYSCFTFLLYNNLANNIVGVYGLLPSAFFDFNNNYNNQYFLHSFSIKSQLNSYVFWLIPCVLYSALISLLKQIIK
ncbi:MAG: hypothetical protein CMP49_05725 [Flavobacteriales bacterium]|jgi:hypothetical protein|nr:hypothetical protein [Flavobacteriales bacterium]|tara:strand:+ start:561 stop:1037 length:477 start_codon:yes stop_codon:yes gene_type:complete